MTPVQHNPAARLLRILTEASQQPANLAALQTWASVLGCEKDDHATLLERLLALQELHAEAFRLVQRYTDEHNRTLYERSFRPTRTVISAVNLSAAWEGHRNLLSNDVLLGLEHASDLLRQRGYREPSDDDVRTLNAKLEEIERQVADLTTRVVDSDLDDYLRNYILENLEYIRRAISEFRIRGTEGLRRALQEGFGVIHHLQQYYFPDGETNPAKPIAEVVKEYITTLANLDSVTSLILRIPKLARHADKAIALIEAIGKSL